MIGRNADNTPTSRRFVVAALMIVVVAAALLFFLFVDGGLLESADLPQDTTADLATRSSDEPTNVTRRRDAADALESARRKESERDRRRLRGTVIDTDGRPADAVTIKLIDPADATGNSADAALQFTPTPSEAEAATDAEGRFEVVAPKDGRFLIVARRGTAEFSDFREVNVPAANGIEIVLKKDDTLSCIAVGDDNLPVSGVEIAVVRNRIGPVPGYPTEWCYREIVRSGDDGTFLVPDSPTDGRRLRSLAGSMIRHGISIGARRDADASTQIWLPLNAARDEVGRCVLAFAKTAPLTIVLEFRGCPPPDTFMFSLTTEDRAIHKTLTSTGGRDVVWSDCPAATTAVVHVQTPPWQLKAIDPSNSAAAVDSFELGVRAGLLVGVVGIPRLDASPRDLKLTFDQGRSISVRFVDATTRKPVAGISASFTHNDRGDSSSPARGTATSGSDGVAEFSHRPYGTHLLSIDSPDWALVPAKGLMGRSWVTKNGKFQIIEIGADDPRLPSTTLPNNLINVAEIDGTEGSDGHPVEIGVIRAPSLIGRIVDEAGHPIPNATVTIRSKSTSSFPVAFAALADKVAQRTSSVTDLDGRFRVQGFSPGIGGIADARAQGYAPSARAVSALSVGETRDLGAISLAPDRPWTLRLVRPSGEPLIGVTVTVVPVGEADVDQRPDVLTITGGIGPQLDRSKLAVETTDVRGEIVVRGIVADRVAISLVDRPAGTRLPGGKTRHECAVDPSTTCVVTVDVTPVVTGRVILARDVKFAEVTVTAIPSTIPVEEIEKARAEGRDIGDPNGSASEQRDFRRALRGSARVQADGTFEIEVPTNGEYALEVTGRGVNFSREDRTLGGSLLSSVVELYEVDRPLAVTERVNPPVKLKRIGPRIPASAIEMASEESVIRAREFFPQYFEK